MIDTKYKEAIRRAMALRLPFVAYAMPGDDKVSFWADIDEAVSGCEEFIVNSWCGGSADEYVINCNADADRVLAYSGPECSDSAIKPWTETTSNEQYISCVDELIDRLRDFGGKTVYSRTICGDGTTVDWLNVVDNYFSIHTEAMRYMFYTPRHGCWLGASPELLLRINGNRFTTMALAGTRAVTDGHQPWDGKNIAEQGIVRRYIEDRIYDLGLQPEVGETHTLRTGNIEHLCTIITGSCGDCKFEDLLRALNPTPALAGYPLPSALENIVELEHHPRRCYGAYVALKCGSDVDCFVNLRCVNFDEASWCMYVGSGIMPDSDSADEWLETQAKATLLLNLILKAGGRVR